MNTLPYITIFLSSFRQGMRERSSQVFRCFFYLMILLVFNALWRAVTHGGVDVIQGFSTTDLFWYTMGAEAATICIFSNRIEQIAREIVDGTVETELLRPTSIVGMRIAAEAGISLSRLMPLWTVGTVVVTSLVGLPDNPWSLLIGIPVAALAVACNVAGVHLFSSFAFWFAEARATWFVYQKSVFALGGMVYPLVFLPDWAQTVCWMLPFWTMTNAAGMFSSSHFNWLLILGQLGWLVVLCGLSLAIYARGERRIQAGVQ